MTEATATEQVVEQPAVTVPAVETPTPAPATKVEDKPAPKKEEAGEIEYEETGDPKLDIALKFFGKHGLDAEHPAIKSAIDGDFTALEAYLAEKDAKGWEQHVALAKESHKAHGESVAAAEKAVTDAVSGQLEKAGVDNEHWGKVIAWAAENAEPEEREELNKTLASGPLGAKMVTAYLLGLYADANTVEQTPMRGAIREDQGARGTGQSDQDKPLTRAQFSQEAEKLYRAKGQGYMQTPEYAQLRKRAGL